MNATQSRININRTNAKRLRAAGFNAEADAYDATADALRDELNERERRRVAAKHAATNPDEPLLECQRLAALVPDGPRQGWISKTDRLPKNVYNDWDTFTRAVDGIDGYGMMGDRD